MLNQWGPVAVILGGYLLGNILLNRRIDDLRDSLNTRFDDLRETIRKRFDDLHDLLRRTEERLEHPIVRQS